MFLLSVLLVAALEPLASSTPDPNLNAPGPVVVAERDQPIDMSALRASFDSTGRFRLDLPALGVVVVDGAEDGTIAGIAAVAVDPVTGAKGPPVPTKSIAIKGSLQGYSPSLARLLLGSWGLYGIIVVDGVMYDLYPSAMGVQHVKQEVVNSDDFIPKVPDLSGGIHTLSLTVSTVAYYADYSYTTTHPDWFDRLSSAFQQMDGSGMWQVSIVEIDMALPYIYYVTGNNIVTSTDSGVAIQQYRNYMATHLISGVKAYELWSSLNFDGASTYAVSSISDAFQYAGEWSTSVAEGTNFCCDLYDANSAYQRGIVGGHEFAHIYGEENHPGGCNFYWTNCNIMQTSIDNSGRKFYFEGSTKNEIRCRFYYGLEYGVNC